MREIDKSSELNDKEMSSKDKKNKILLLEKYNWF